MSKLCITTAQTIIAASISRLSQQTRQTGSPRVGYVILKTNGNAFSHFITWDVSYTVQIFQAAE